MEHELEVLGLQAVRRALDEVKAASDSPLARDRLDRAEVVLARVVASLALRPGFEAGLSARPADGPGGIAWDDTTIRAWEAQVRAFDPRTTPGGTNEDLAPRLGAYIARRDAAARVTSVRRLPGGRSKQTLVVELQGAAHLPARLVLRTDSTRTTSDDSVLREYPLIHAVHQAGCPTPTPLWLEPDAGVIGAPFIAFAHMPGAPAGDLWGAFDKSGGPARALAAALARLQRIPASQAPGGRAQPAREAVAALFEDYRERWARKTAAPSPVMANAFAWLAERLDRLQGEAVIVHGDAHFANMLMEGDKLVCLLDWEFWHFGHPAEDLAYCRPYVEQSLDWDLFMEAYAEAGGAGVEPCDLDLFAVWRPLRNAVLSSMIAYDFRETGELDLETAAIALSTLPRMEAQVAAALAKATT